MKQERRVPSNTCLFDIETTNLGADFGIILCAVIKPLGRGFKPRVFRLDKYKNTIADEDKHLVNAIRMELDRYQFIIGHNSIRFDVKFINTRLMFHHLDVLKERLHIDTLTLARRVLRIRSRRLESIINFLEIPEKKTPIESKLWRHAMLGDKRAMDKVVKHCIQDVLSLELVYERLEPFIKTVRRI